MSDLLRNYMSTSHTIRAHAQEVWDKSNKDSVGQEENAKSDLPLIIFFSNILK